MAISKNNWFAGDAHTLQLAVVKRKRVMRFLDHDDGHPRASTTSPPPDVASPVQATAAAAATGDDGTAAESDPVAEEE